MKKNPGVWPLFVLLLAIGSSLLLFGCGGESGSSGESSSSVDGVITGSAVKGPVSGAMVSAFAINNGTMGAQIGTCTTDTLGNFTVFIGPYAGPVMLRMSGGMYTDEATGAAMSMQPGDIMTCVIPQVIASSVMSGVQITPLTSMAQMRAQSMNGGMNPANIAAANTTIGSYFSIGEILYTHPMNPLTLGSGSGATQEMRNYGMVLAAMSEYAHSIGMPFSSGIVTAMMNDASDGVINGMMGNMQIMMGGMGGMMSNNPLPTNAGTSGLAGAMTTFMRSAMNRSGLTVANMQALMNQISGGMGAVTFRSNGERIYFTATSERGAAITYTGGPASGGLMMMGGQLACVSCHGPNGRGGKHSMGMMQVMDAKDIRWSVLQPEFDAEKFRLAVVKGQDPDGTQLNSDMPRWNISIDDLADLIAFLKTLP
jgi:mono/diheme cytochrome c family protein